MRLLTTVAEVMDALGGNTPVGRLTRRGAQAVSNWRRAASFPSNTYVAMISALHLSGFDAPVSLWGMVVPFGNQGEREERARARAERTREREAREAREREERLRKRAEADAWPTPLG